MDEKENTLTRNDADNRIKESKESVILLECSKCLFRTSDPTLINRYESKGSLSCLRCDSFLTVPEFGTIDRNNLEITVVDCRCGYYTDDKTVTSKIAQGERITCPACHSQNLECGHGGTIDSHGFEICACCGKRMRSKFPELLKKAKSHNSQIQSIRQPSSGF